MGFGKVVLYLMGEKGAYTLSELLREYGPGIIEYAVVGSDKNVINDFSGEIRDRCSSESIRVFDRKDMLPEFDGYAFAIGWRWLISANENRLIVFHDSLLPKYRGFAPLVNMLINGEKEIGVTALYAAEEYDAGEIISQKSIAVEYPVKIEDAIHKIRVLYAENAIKIVGMILNGMRPPSTAQCQDSVTFSPWRDILDYNICWSWDAAKVARMIDAVGYPYAGACTSLDGKRVYIDEATAHMDINVEAASDHLGKLIFIRDGKPFVVCGKGTLEIIDGHYEDGTQLLPIDKFRSRFGM